MDVANPLSSCLNKSAMVPPPMVSTAEPAQPAKNRKPISMLRLEDTAQATVRMVKRMLVV